MMCKEAKEREEREGWSLDEILEEERDKREALKQRRDQSQKDGWRFSGEKRELMIIWTTMERPMWLTVSSVRNN